METEKEKEEEPVSELSREGALSSATVDSSVQRVGASTEITEETTDYQHQRRQPLIVEILPRTLEDARDDFAASHVPPTPSHSPKRVKFSPIPSPGFSKMNKSPDPSTSGKSSMRSFIPKLSFKFRNNPSDIEKAATILALGGSSLAAREKPLTSRTMSFTNIFTPRAKRPSSLPVTPIAHSNPESTHGGNSINPHGFSVSIFPFQIYTS
uniref:Protein binding protein n=1 Tax=Rhizophora mucronata TaxID=61149 RepID=A0A2P2M0U4_RHIMU